MFVAHEKNSKKSFQKPNILRKKSKIVPKSLIDENPPKTAVVSSVIEPKFVAEPVTKVYRAGPSKKLLSKTKATVSSSDILLTSNEHDDANSLLTSNNLEPLQPSINVESFINSTVPVQSISLQDIEDEIKNKTDDEWCFDFINDGQEIVIEDVDGSQLGSLCVATNRDEVATASELEQTQSTDNTSTEPVTTITLEYLASSAMNFKCDIAGCKKRFRSEQKLDKHKLTHSSGPKVAKQLTLECPVKKTSEDGAEERCGQVCSSKEELVNHLNQNHDPEDAMYICAECGRRFFWASGLRAHSRSHCSKPTSFACVWPGCGREFRQPCRLREHMRAHTGDKPYPCHYPNCGWSFRTASKLVRHALRHSGERRHACGACGRAFRRRDHVRDHYRRHHRARLPCPKSGCKKQFTDLETLKLHMDIVHKDNVDTDNVNGIEEESVLPQETVLEYAESEETFKLISAASNSEVLTMPQAEVTTESNVDCDGDGDNDGDGEVVVDGVGGRWQWQEARAARTHCTWPLDSRQHNALTHDKELVLEEDVQVELSEGSESNTYTIRSDLFLHGNVLNNEDSEQMGGESSSLLVVGADADLGMLDAHPHADLMQEELLYTDSAVDESSFRVFLLSGEELS